MTDIALNLVIGSTLELESLSDDVLSNLHSELIGYTQDQSIILAHPKKEGIPVQMDVGDKFYVGLKQGDDDVTFETEVAAVLNNPYPHIHATYPTNIRQGTFRKSNRIPAASAKIHLVNIGGSDYSQLTILDVSCDGACLVADNQLGSEDNQFEIEIQSDSGQININIDCMIRYVREVKDKDHSSFHHGVVFIGMDAETQLSLWKYVQESSTLHKQASANQKT